MPEHHENTVADILKPVLMQKLIHYELTNEITNVISQYLKQYLHDQLELNDLQEKLQTLMPLTAKKYLISVPKKNQQAYHQCFLEYGYQVDYNYNKLIQLLCDVHYHGWFTDTTTLNARFKETIWELDHPQVENGFAYQIRTILNLWQEEILTIL